jgi:hypothetical protein
MTEMKVEGFPVIKNQHLFEEVHHLLQQVKRTKQRAEWRGTVITPVDTGIIKIQHGNMELQHKRIALLAVALLSRFHCIEL